MATDIGSGCGVGSTSILAATGCLNVCCGISLRSWWRLYRNSQVGAKPNPLAFVVESKPLFFLAVPFPEFWCRLLTLLLKLTIQT